MAALSASLTLGIAVATASVIADGARDTVSADGADRSSTATGRVLRVGPGRALRTPSAASAVARGGDTVHLDAGTYPGDVATWTQDDLTLRGAGGPVNLPAHGRNAQGKAIWVIAGDRTRVDGITFTGARVPDGNGAGIRQEGTGLVITRSVFRGNQNGILAGADPRSDIVIRGSRFIANGAGDGYTHNIYIGEVRSLTVTGSVIASASVGHEVKSRAARTVLQGNLITDRNGTASYSVDLPNGGAALIAGNVLVQGPRSENPALISYGAEGLTHPSRQLWVVNNTLVNRRSSGTFVVVADGARAEMRNNLLVGPGRAVSGSAGIRADRRVTTGAFVAPAREDYRLRTTSVAVNRGVVVPVSRRAVWEFAAPVGQMRRPVVGRPDLGAFELRPVTRPR